MARFVWRLQKVLDLKQRLEEVKRAELMQIAQQIAQMQALLWTHRRIVEKTCNEVAAMPADRRPFQQGFFMKYVVVNDQTIAKIKANIDQLRANHAKVAQELLQMRRTREALERLRERAMERFLQEQRRLEQKQTDDMATLGFVRGSMGLSDINAPGGLTTGE
ncbi:MAG: flagellar export protein FliJ [Sedimentisphaerales bacterium]|nr:flagellar export protein FliJ [Sedimentisphaerales bacterium]